jgi:hypothetical protein
MGQARQFEKMGLFTGVIKEEVDFAIDTAYL